MNQHKKIRVQTIYIVFFLTIICFALMILSTAFPGFSGPFKEAGNTIVIPLEKGIKDFYDWYCSL